MTSSAEAHRADMERGADRLLLAKKKRSGGRPAPAAAAARISTKR